MLIVIVPVGIIANLAVVRLLVQKLSLFQKQQRDRIGIRGIFMTWLAMVGGLFITDLLTE